MHSIWPCTILFSVILLQAQTTPVQWRGKISLGGDTVSVHGTINLKESCELYLQTTTLQVAENLSGEDGSRVYLSADAHNGGFIDISGTVTGSIEMIPAVSTDWDGSRIDFVKAYSNGSQTSAFHTINYAERLKYENGGNYLTWFIERTKPVSCLPLIVQLANHTLLVNNNSETNDGHAFVYYVWYKDGRLLKEGSQADNGGSYYTGGDDLDEKAEYTVEATDSAGTRYLSCPYRFIRQSLPVDVAVYPNPVPRNSKANIQVETADLSLLKNASVEIYDVLGVYVGKTAMDGQKLVSLGLPAQSGVYMLKFKAKDYVKVIRVIVK